MVETITITRRTRNLGFGWSTIPTGRGTEITIPTRPQHEGTVKQVLEDRRCDRNYRASRSGGALMSTAWFYKGRRIVTINGCDDGYAWSHNDFMGGLLDGMFNVLTITVK